MIRKERSPIPGHVRVLFELPSCVWADRIFVTGDFNDWDQTATPMQQSRSGVWQATVDLVADREYQFRYLVDGEWLTDSHADGFTSNTFGSQNSVIVASLPEDEVRQPVDPILVHEVVPLQPYRSHTLSPRRPVTNLAA